VAISTTPHKPPRRAAAAAAAAAAAVEPEETLESDEKELPPVLPVIPPLPKAEDPAVAAAIPVIPPLSVVLMRTIRAFVDDSGRIIDLAPNQVIRHATDDRWSSACAARELSGAERMSNSTYCVHSVIYYSPKALVLHARRALDSEDFVVKLMHERISSSTHWSDYACERLSVWLAMQKCKWKHIVRQFAVEGPTADTPCMSVRMEVAGQSMLMDLFGPGTLLRREQIVNAMRDVFSGLAELHALGIIHNAVGANNYLKTTSGRYKLNDLDAATVGSITTTKFARRLVVASNPHCVAQEIEQHAEAPESASIGSHGFATSALDMWNTGIVFYALVTGFAAFAVETPELTRQAVAWHFKDESIVLGAFERCALLKGFSVKEAADARDLLRQIFTNSQETRIDAAGALQHAFFTADEKKAAPGAVQSLVVDSSAEATPLALQYQAAAVAAAASASSPVRSPTDLSLGAVGVDL
jgi:hypothetical protein